MRSIIGKRSPERGYRIKLARLARQLTLKAVAEPLNVSHGLISQWEAGHGEPKGELLEKLAFTLGTSEKFITNGDAVVVARLALEVQRMEQKDEVQRIARERERQRIYEENRLARQTAGELAREQVERIRRLEEDRLCRVCRKRPGVLTGSRYICQRCWSA